MANNSPVLTKPPKIRFEDTPASNAFPIAYGKFEATDSDGDTPIKFSVANQQVSKAARVNNFDEDMAISSTHRVRSDYGTLYFNENTGHYSFIPKSFEINQVGATSGFIRVESFVITARSPNHDDPTRTSHSTPQELVIEVKGADEGIRFSQLPTDNTITIDENVVYTTRTQLHDFGAESTTGDSVTISYSIQSDETIKGFQVDERNGILTYGGVGFDHETTDEISVTVIANAGGVGLVRQIITIRIEDIDEPLEFTATTFTLLENRAGSQTNPIVVGQVYARDPDDDGNPHDGGAATSYEIVSGSLPDNFAFDTATGEITYTGGALDYEARSNKNIVNVMVEASFTADSGFTYTATARVQVRLGDEDEQPTGIRTQIIRESVTTNTQTATHLATFIFTDDALGENVASVPENSIFEIRNNNQLWLKADQTLTVGEQTITPTFTTTGIGTPPTDRPDFTLEITLPDNKPTEINLSAENVTVDEGTIGTARKLADITFVDQADGGRGTNSVTIPTSDIFEVRNGNELWLKAGAVLDYETATSHDIELTFSGTGEGDAPEAQTFTLNVRNVNEAPVLPTLSGPTYTDTTAIDDFADDNPTGETGTFTATDQDAGATLTYIVAQGATTATQTSEATRRTLKTITNDDGTTTTIYSTHSVGGAYGTLHYNKDTGDYEYVPKNDEMNAVADGIRATDAFQVTANDGSLNSAPQTFTVTIDGANDPATAFEVPTGLEITEHQAGTTQSPITIGTVTITDVDGGGGTQYTLSGAPSGFSITNAGVIQYIGSGVDYESLAAQNYIISFTVQVDELTAQTVRITVLDANDPATKFTLNGAGTNNAAFQIDENQGGTTENPLTIGTVTATDPDGETQYRLSGAPSGFSITDAGVIQYVGPGFDYSTTQRITFSVSVDNLPAQNIEIVIILIDDVPTAMTLSATSASADEGTIGSARKLADISFTDDGVGANSVSVPTSAIFEVRNGNQLWLKAGAVLDYETAMRHDIKLTFSGTGVGTPPAAQTFRLTVNDIDEVPTAFTLSTTSGSANEGTSTRTKLADVSITDDALGTYTPSLTAGGTYFELVQEAGGGYALYLKAGQTLTVGESQTATISLTASGTGTLPAAQTFTLTVTDVNEAPVLPTLSGPTYEDTEEENDFTDDAPTGETGNFGATDADAGATITYTVAQGATTAAQTSGDARLTLKTVTNDDDTTTTIYSTHSVKGAFGTLYYNKDTGDYKYVPDNDKMNAVADETNAEDIFQVTANDGRADSTPKTFTVTIEGANDKATAFTVPTGLELAENRDGSGESNAIDIGSVTATDVDGGTQYTLSGAGATDFSITDAGVIQYTGSGFNYETLTPAQRTISFMVQVDDLPAQEVTITVLDDTPVINSLPGNLRINENQAASPIGDAIVATDAGNNAITYTLEDAPDDFEINPATGQIRYTGSGLDHEANAAILLMVVATVDDDSISVAVAITVVDVNEVPVLARSSFAYNQGESVIVLDTTHLSTTDEDETDGAGQLTYTITGTLPSAGKLQVLGDHDNDDTTADTWADITTTFKTFTQADINAGRVRYVPTDPQATTGTSFTFTVEDGKEDNVAAVSGTLNINVREVLTVAMPEDSDEVDLDTAGGSGAKTVNTGNGLDTIKTGTGNDRIAGGLGNDDISLQNDEGEEDGADEIIYRFSVSERGDWVAFDGADRITGFTRGEDKIVFQIEAREITGITTLEQFLIAARGADEVALTRDDQFQVQPRFVYDSGSAEVSGIAFYFRDAGNYGNGKFAIGSLVIEFAARLTPEAFVDLVRTSTDDTNIASTLAIEDLTVLPNLLGEGSIEFRLIHRVVEDSTRFATIDGQVTLENAQSNSLKVQAGSGTNTPIAADATSITGTYGTLTVNQDGSWDYALTNSDDGATNALGSGQTRADIFTFTYRNGDGDTLTHTLTLTIEGRTDMEITTSAEFDQSAATADLTVHNENPSSGAQTIRTGAGNDIILPSETIAHQETIYAGAGDDEIYGGGGDDALHGEAGNDYLSGGAGQDRLTGGTGNDIFVLSVTNTQTTDVDIVTDFARGDKIEIDTADGTETTLPTANSLANIRWEQNTDISSLTGTSTNDASTPDTVIYHTRGTADTGDDVILMVLEDYTTPLTIGNFEIV